MRLKEGSLGKCHRWGECLVVWRCSLLILGIWLDFGCRAACHVWAVAAGGVVTLRTFSPALPVSAFEG